MKLRVAITTSDLSSLEHRQAYFSALSGLTVLADEADSQKAVKVKSLQQVRLAPRGNFVEVSVTDRQGRVHSRLKTGKIALHPNKSSDSVFIDSLKRPRAKGLNRAEYLGEIIVSARQDRLRIVVALDLELYLKGVLESEIPASYHLEALKAQAVAARTYALNPRISHEKDDANVCDSYLCCQYFAGHLLSSSPRHTSAIKATEGEILTWQKKPILALFSSNAGGHTANYENCFSDPKTNQFPPPAIPYLKGVPEGPLPGGFNSGATESELEAALKELWHTQKPSTFDSRSPHFKWSVRLPAQALEAHMHHELSLLMKDMETAPFVIPPKSGQFGHIQKFEVIERGVSGVAIQLSVHTSTGQWLVKKELIIRSAFKNSEIKLSRLKSAKIFFEHEADSLGLLSAVTVRGLGWGHGVGLQQTGAQGMAILGKTYREILSHYFTNVQIDRIGS